MRYSITASGAGAIRLNEQNPAYAILQNIAIILSTPRGSVPMYRDFGINMAFLDKPEPIARVMLSAAIKEAIDDWEPRASVLDVTFAQDPSNPGRIIPTVEVEINIEQ